MSTRNSIPLHFQWSTPDGKLTQQAAFYLQQLGNGLAPSGTGYVLNGSQPGIPDITLFIGLDSNKGGTPSVGQIYFAQDTGVIYTANGSSWEAMDGALTGDVTKAVGTTNTVLANVNPTIGTFGGLGSLAQFTVNSKGLITSATNLPLITGGTVTSVNATSSTLTITGGPIVAAGVLDIELPSTGVVAGTYLNTTLTVDAYGRITAASTGTGGSGAPRQIAKYTAMRAF